MNNFLSNYVLRKEFGIIRMHTPICDFVEKYAKSDIVRLHMPGHKGREYIGNEAYDITEIDGADSLYEACGIIRQSEENAGFLFGANTFYSTEGSSLCIRAMLYMACLFAKENGERPVIAASRNAHKTFLSAAALLDFDILWLYGRENESYLSCSVTSDFLDEALKSAEKKPVAVYITSPDYLGNIADIGAISEVCKKNGVLLLVDNAHGAYLKFLKKSEHPIDLGADMCCDSAHKTLPALTGAAYLHISHSAPDLFHNQAKSALGLFGSTSPSYLILKSLDALNRYIADGYEKKLNEFSEKVKELKQRLKDLGFTLLEQEPLKLTVAPKSWGYTGAELAGELLSRNLMCEFYDSDFTVLMLTPELGEDVLKKIEAAMSDIPKKQPIVKKAPKAAIPEKVMTVREAVFSKKEEIPASEALGRVFAGINISCPPAVPIIACGERIDETVLECFSYYGIESCTVIKE